MEAMRPLMNGTSTKFAPYVSAQIGSASRASTVSKPARDRPRSRPPHPLNRLMLLSDCTLPTDCRAYALDHHASQRRRHSIPNLSHSLPPISSDAVSARKSLQGCHL